jgi:hypothetical protein
MIGMSKILTILNRAAWLISSVSIIVVVVIVRNYVGSRAEISSLREEVTSGQKSIDAATKRNEGRDTALRQQIREIEALKRRVRTPGQVVAALSAALPQLPLPITVSRPVDLREGQNAETNHLAPLGTTGPANSGSANVSTDRSGVVLRIPDDDLKPMFDNLQDCREATATVATLKRNLTDTVGQLSVMTTERNMALRKTSPNTKWSNVKQAAKWLVVGATLGLALSQKL